MNDKRNVHSFITAIMCRMTSKAQPSSISAIPTHSIPGNEHTACLKSRESPLSRSSIITGKEQTIFTDSRACAVFVRKLRTSCSRSSNMREEVANISLKEPPVRWEISKAIPNNSEPGTASVLSSVRNTSESPIPQRNDSAAVKKCWSQTIARIVTDVFKRLKERFARTQGCR